MKTVKKTKKAPIKKVLTVKKAPKKKLTTKKAVISKTKPILRKKLVLKKKKSLKPIGLFIAIGGLLSLILLIAVAISNSSIADLGKDTVLGVTSLPASSSEVIATKPIVAKPLSIQTTVTAKGVMVSWAGSDVDGFVLYRKSGLLGSRVRIATNIRPTEYKNGYPQTYPKTTPWPLAYYIDTNVRKSSFVTYYVVATKNYCLVTGCGVASSNIASGKMTWNNKAITKVDTFSAYSNTAKSISVDAIIDKTKQYFVKVTCTISAETCGEFYSNGSQYVNGAKYLLSVSGQNEKPYNRVRLMDYIGKKDGYYKFQIGYLKPGIRYGVEISLLTAFGFDSSNPDNGNVYETIIGGPRSVATSSTITTPDMPTKLIYDGMTRQDDGGLSGGFKWAFPEKPVDGYDMSLSCETNRLYIQQGIFVNPSSWGADIGGRYAEDTFTFDSNSTYLPMGIGHYIRDLGVGRGLCTVKLTAYNTNANDEKISGPSASVIFGDVTVDSLNLLNPAAPTGLKYNSQYNNGEVVWLKIDVPNPAPEGYIIDVSCTKSGETTSVLTDYIPTVSYVTTGDPYVEGPVYYDEINLDGFGIGHGECTANMRAFNYDYQGGKQFSESTSVVFNN